MDSKHLLKSKTYWFGLAVAALPLLQSLAEVETLPSWILGVIGGTIILLRWLTSSAVTLGRVVKKSGVVSLLVILAVGVGGCGAAMCDKIIMIRKPHPKLPKPAATVVHKCGDRTTEMRVKKLPKCLEACFDESK